MGHDYDRCLFFAFRHFDDFLYHHFVPQVRWIEPAVRKHNGFHIIIYMYNNNMNSPKQGTTVVVKKGMGFFTSFVVILGLCCLCSCLSSMWTTAKGVSAVSSAAENSHKKKTVGPIIKDVEVIDVSNESSFESSVEVKGENVTISDYEHSYKGTLNGDKTEGVMNLMEYNLDNNPIKVGCGAGEDFKTEKLKFKWNVRE